MRPLLAKKVVAGRAAVTLVQHSVDVMDAVESLFGSNGRPTRLARAWLRFFNLSLDHFQRFLDNLLAAAACHDWGKANESFLNALEAGGQQAVRHEHLSALMLGLDAVTTWLSRHQNLDTDLILSAVLTHHLKASRDINQRYAFAALPVGVRSFRVWDDHPDFARLVQVISERLRLPPLTLPLTNERYWSFQNDDGSTRPGTVAVELQRDRVQRRLRRLDKELQQLDEDAIIRRRMLWAIRAGLIAADAAGSGLRRIGESLQDWIDAMFDESRICDEHFVTRQVIDKRIADLERQGKWKNWSDFQRDCATLPSRSLLLAPCGAGKTLAAWRWIAAQASQQPIARVLFLYPTRATAKEGFRDYVSWAPAADAALIHGTAAFDLQDMFRNPDDPRHENEYEADSRLFAIGFWTRRVFSATVDQFLAFLQYGYGPVCMLPVLVDSVAVIDEVHSFDRNMFACLKDFLKNFDVPVLCMTATLPNDRRAELESECGLTTYDEKPRELNESACAPRYRLRRTTKMGAIKRIRTALNEGKRVLWVVNQVKRAQQGALELAEDFRPDLYQESLHAAPNVSLFCYHSRFKLSDRVRRHNEVVESFRDGGCAALAITTQVCEMSLDMDADLLVTEECPITSLIQRMGRCNRVRRPRSLAVSGEVLVYKSDDPRPYDAASLTGVDEFLTRLIAQDQVNQTELEDALKNAPVPPTIGDPSSSFLESGPYAVAGDEGFRDIEEFSRPAILKSNVETFLKADKAEQPGFIVPIPRKLSRESDQRLPAYFAVAADDHYHKAIGFCDYPLQEMA